MFFKDVFGDLEDSQMWINVFLLNDDHVSITSLPVLTASCGFEQFTAKFLPIIIQENRTRCSLSYIKTQKFSPYYITLPN